MSNPFYRLDNGNTHSRAAIQVVIESFGYLHGPAPEDAYIVLDTRTLFRNPHADPGMRQKTGFDVAVAEHVMATDGVRSMTVHAARMVRALVAEVGDPQNKMVRLAVGCGGGRHRSVVIAEAVGGILRAHGIGVDVLHRDVAKPVVQ